MTETNEEQRTPGFQRTLLSKLIAAGVFVAIGTVAVFYSMRVCQDCEIKPAETQQLADAEGQSEDQPATELSKAPVADLQVKPVSAKSTTAGLPPISNSSKSQNSGPPTTQPNRLTSLTPAPETKAGSNNSKPAVANPLPPNRVTTQRPPSKSFVPTVQSEDSTNNSSNNRNCSPSHCSFLPPIRQATIRMRALNVFNSCQTGMRILLPERWKIRNRREKKFRRKLATLCAI